MEHATTKQRKEISPEASLAAYDYAKKVIDEDLTITEAQNQLAQEHSVNANSALGLINNVRTMVEGKEYKWTSNVFTVSLFLRCIHADFGEDTLVKALNSIEKHIHYYENRRKITLRSLRKLVGDYRAKQGPKMNKQEQEELITKLTQEQLTQETLLKRLDQLHQTGPERIKVHQQVYRRHNYAVALIKMIRGFSCQICGTTITKRDGFYIEAAHITPKYKGGDESLPNILILCPNHHKEFDLGDTQILQRSADRVVFTMNGTRYDLSLKFP